jgi:type I restriction enzyme S subunit
MFHENSSVGTTVIHLGKKEIDSFKTLIPPNNIIQSFGETTEPILEQIVNNSKENRNLKSLRDTLLPKLISGELEVKDV